MHRDAITDSLPAETGLLSLQGIGCDDFERELLPLLLRGLMETWRHPEARCWTPVYGAAAARWGPRTGLSLAHSLAQSSDTLLRIRGHGLRVLAASDTDHAEEVTPDERLPLLLLHKLRRNHVAAGQDFLLKLTGGEMDEEHLALALDFAQRHFCGAPRAIRHDGSAGPHRRAV
jgi:hypothetical protein